MSSTEEVAVDDRGVPVEVKPGEVAAPHCPAAPCQLCTGVPVDGGTSWEWCQKMDTCAATVDWDAIAERQRDFS